VVAALSLTGEPATLALAGRVALGLLAVGLVASSNYTINEVLDAPYDRLHPTKRNRPVPGGRVHIPLAYVQWIALGVVGVALGAALSTGLAWALAALWVMGCVYNIRPLRTKDLPYLDVLSEAINNPLRMIAGWYLVVTDVVPPATLLTSYWMVGCYFMAIKRFSEFRQIGDPAKVAAYRKSLAALSPERMLVAITFYGSAAMLFFGAFIMRYRLELVAAFPLVAVVMARYLEIGFRMDSAAQNPEKLYKERALMSAVVLCTAVMGVLMFLELPALREILDPSFLRGAPVDPALGAADAVSR
jgi:4-hydroxybenzoate polyprenyltransferase